MENVADALKMAAAILIFIIAIASSFSLFGTAKQTADSIIRMRDKQAYLEAAEEEVGGILYTSSSSITGNNEEDSTTTEYVSGVTKNGDRVVKIDDVISTIYRYSVEKYGVTIVNEADGTVLARFDSATESLMRLWDQKVKDENGNLVSTISDENKQKYIGELKKNLKNDYVQNITLDLETIYESSNTNGVYAPWYGNNEEIQERINVDINGGTFKNDFKHEYQGKNLLSTLNSNSVSKIIEVTNEIDNSKYVEDSNLLQQYEMPTIEVVYIVD